MNLLSFEEFESEVTNPLQNNLVKMLGTSINCDPNILNFLTRRYLDLFKDKEIPSKRVFIDYINSENHKYEKAAISCEFWGGIFYEHMIKDPITSEDIRSKLSLAYDLLGNLTGIISFKFCSKYSEKILLSFRETSRELGIPIRKNLEDKVIRLSF